MLGGNMERELVSKCASNVRGVGVSFESDVGMNVDVDREGGEHKNAWGAGKECECCCERVCERNGVGGVCEGELKRRGRLHGGSPHGVAHPEGRVLMGEGDRGSCDRWGDNPRPSLIHALPGPVLTPTSLTGALGWSRDVAEVTC